MPIRAQDNVASDRVKRAEEIFGEAQERLDHDQYDAALKGLRQAAALAPENQDYLSAYGSLLAEVGKKEEAIQVLQRGVQLFPDCGYEKYMYLGQLLSGDDAIKHLRKGIQTLQQELASQANSKEREELQSQLASGLCSLAEMHLASQRKVEEFEVECEQVLLQARTVDASSPEPLQVLASLRYEQGQPEKALQALKESLALWFRRAPERDEEKTSQDGEDDEGEDDEAMEEDLKTPSFEFRFETAKLLLELDDGTEDVVQILLELLAENDQNVHVYYLLAMANAAGGDKESGLAALEKGEEILKKLKYPQDDPAVLAFCDLKENLQAMKS